VSPSISDYVDAHSRYILYQYQHMEGNHLQLPCTYQRTHHNSDLLQVQVRRSRCHTPLVAVEIVTIVQGNTSLHPSSHLCQTFVVGGQLDGLPYHNVVEKHCSIRRCAPFVIIVGLQTSSPPPQHRNGTPINLGRGRGRIDTISKSTKVCVLTRSGKLERALWNKTV
jgi:hypothetical protein